MYKAWSPTADYPSIPTYNYIQTRLFRLQRRTPKQGQKLPGLLGKSTQTET